MTLHFAYRTTRRRRHPGLLLRSISTFVVTVRRVATGANIQRGHCKAGLIAFCHSSKRGGLSSFFSIMIRRAPLRETQSGCFSDSTNSTPNRSDEQTVGPGILISSGPLAFSCEAPGPPCRIVAEIRDATSSVCPFKFWGLLLTLPIAVRH
jgi:hypothetical protein